MTKKKNGNKVESVLKLITAIFNLIIAIVLLLDKLKGT